MHFTLKELSALPALPTHTPQKGGPWPHHSDLYDHPLLSIPHQSYLQVKLDLLLAC